MSGFAASPLAAGQLFIDNHLDLYQLPSHKNRQLAAKQNCDWQNNGECVLRIILPHHFAIHPRPQSLDVFFINWATVFVCTKWFSANQLLWIPLYTLISYDESNHKANIMNAIADYDKEINRVVDHLKKANDVFVVTGAGISADSGLPTYRGLGGLYDNKETEDGIPIEKALSGPMFRSRPELTWKYLAEIEKGARDAKHNRAHEVLAEMESHFDRMWILTQNIDGFHSTAGSKNVIEIHGNMHRMKCTECSYSEAYEDYSNFDIPPVCPDCNSMVRPDVVLFEEQLPQKQIETLYREAEKLFDFVISIGTSSYFPYIVEPVLIASRLGIPTLEINPSETTISNVVGIKLPLRAAESLGEIWKRFSSS